MALMKEFEGVKAQNTPAKNGYPPCNRLGPIVTPRPITAEKLLSTLCWDPEPGTIFLCTPGKCGTTWMQKIVSLLVHSEEVNQKPMNDVSIFIDHFGTRDLASTPRPLLLKTHLFYKYVPKSDSAKYILLFRNPKDTIVSSFGHYKTLEPDDGDKIEWDKFVDRFMEGETAVGDIFDYMLSWLPHLDEPNVIWMTYEDLIKDTAKSVERIGRFIGGTALERVEDKKYLEMVVEKTSFKTMKANAHLYAPIACKEGTSFFRKGKISDWKTAFSPEQSKMIDEVFEKKLGNTMAANWWQEEMA